MTDFPQQVLSKLPSDYPWAAYFDYVQQVDSTNTRLKALARQGAPEGTILIAESQYGGRGRMGRSFHSPEGQGIYMSILLRPQCLPHELMHLTCAVGCAMCGAVEHTLGLRPGIKWINDLVWNRKKLGGILVELGLSPSGGLDYAIAGIGINCAQKPDDFPPELQDKATSLEIISGKNVDRAAIAAAMMESLFRMSSCLLPQKAKILEQYRQDCVTLGQEVFLIREGTVLCGKALDVDENGALLVHHSDGRIEAINSGEVSVRGLYGYL